MFDSTSINKFNFSVNAVSGTLRKSHPKSKFVVRQIDNNQYIFDDTGKPRLKNYGENIVVLQVMLVGDKIGLCEIITEEDWNS